MRAFEIKTFRLAASLAVFAVLVSGCFQGVGAALEATVTPNGGAAIALVPSVSPIPTTELPPPTAISRPLRQVW